MITAMFAMVAIFFFLMVGVLAEGGRKLGNLSRAEDLASEAARSAAATLDLDELTNGLYVIDEGGRARLEADKIVDHIPDAEIVGFVVEDNAVTVTIRITAESHVPGLNIDATASHSASAYAPVGSGP